MALTLLIMIPRLNSEMTMPEGIRRKNRFDQVRPALEYIRENYALPMKIAEIAAVCHMSESHFRRLFARGENISMTPVEYLNQLRVKKACDLIKKTGYSMEEIEVKSVSQRHPPLTGNLSELRETRRIGGRDRRDNYESRLSNFNILIEKGW
ncbi:MAG: AraC family transcriptional regulator [Eubacterium sp.]